MDKFEINIGGTDISFAVLEKGPEGAAHVSLTEARRVKSRVIIPDVIEHEGANYIVTQVGKKAFLSSKSLQFVSLPESVTYLDDWSFGKCINLRKLVIRGDNETVNCPLFGRGVFEDDERLTSICLGYEDDDDLSVLLGMVPEKLKSEHLFSAQDLGQDAWFDSWDKELLNFLAVPDDAGYDELALCGEEDIMYSFPEYVSRSRRRKATLVLNRLMNDYLLSDKNYEDFGRYICGSALFDAWEVIKNDYAENMEMLEMFCHIGAINEGNIDEFLNDMGEEMAAAKAFLIGYKREHFSAGDAFDDLEL